MEAHIQYSNEDADEDGVDQDRHYVEEDCEGGVAGLLV